jgi:hypothetical protein
LSIKAGYQRSFVIFTNEDAGYDSGQKAVGHLRLEVNDGRGKLHVSVQNLRNGNDKYKYVVYLLSNRSDIIRACAGELVPELNKAELNWSFDSGNVDNTGLSINEFDIVAVLVEHNDGGNERVICPLAAYITKKTEWRMRYAASKSNWQAQNAESLSYKGKLYESKAQKSKPQEAKIQVIKSQEIKPQETKPQETKPQDMKPIETKPENAKIQELKPDESEQYIEKPQKIEQTEFKPQDATESQKIKQFEIPTAIDIKELKYQEIKPLAEQPGQTIKSEVSPQENAQDNEKTDQGDNESSFSKFNFEIKIEDMLNKAEAAAQSAAEAADQAAANTADKAAAQSATEAAAEAADNAAAEVADQAAAEAADNAADESEAQDIKPLGVDKINTGCLYLNGNMCAAFVNKEGYPINPCADCKLHNGRRSSPKPTGNVEWLREELTRAFEPSDPFRSRRSDYSWWRVTNPVNLNNMLYQSGIRSPLMFNPAVMLAHYKYRHLIIGIFSHKSRNKQYVVCGVPGMYMVDRKPFGEMSRWVQVEGSKPRYGAFGYWLAYIDPEDGKMLSLD